MNADIIQTLTATFEANAQQTETGVEYWLARDLKHLLGYNEWRNFTLVIAKARTACEVSGHRIADHFVDANKMVELGSGTTRQVEDVLLTRYACYLIAQNGDPRKHEIAFAQTYFAIQTRRAEIIQRRLLDAERVQARKKLSESEKELCERGRPPRIPAASRGREEGGTPSCFRGKEVPQEPGRFWERRKRMTSRQLNTMNSSVLPSLLEGTSRHLRVHLGDKMTEILSA